MFSSQLGARLVRRAKNMTWDELCGRARQEIAKRVDFIASRVGARFMDSENLSVTGAGRFFFEPDEVTPILECIRERLPDVVDENIHQAEQICRHRFDLLGYQGVDYGDHIDWHLDAVHGKRAPRLAWFRVPYLDFNLVGDAKVTWELNRHQHLVVLAKAYRLTGRPKYALQLFEQWYDWQEQNPYPIGINWASSLEVAFRSLSWLWVSHLLGGCSVVPARFARDLSQALMLNGRHIERFLSSYFSPNTHLLGEAVGLFFIGTLCPGSAAAQGWQERGWQIILQEAQRQVHPDGMHFELSTYYHIYALDFFLHARVIAGLNGLSIPAAFDETIKAMLEVVCRLASSGPLPHLGDDDGGRVFDPRRNRFQNMLDPLALGAILFERADFKKVVEDICEETIWLAGVDAVRRFDELSPDCPATTSFALESSGIYVMSSSSSETEQLVANAGPVRRGRDGHRHADALSINICVNGRSVLIDPGTFVYVGQGSERDSYRATASHNTAHIDGVSQAEPGEPFEWKGLSSATVHRWITGSSFDFLEASHDGYRRLQDPVEHRRSIFYLKPFFWLVRDVVAGADVHRVDVRWHFADGSLKPLPSGADFVGNEQAALALLFASTHPWSYERDTHSYSPVYGQKRTAPLLRCTTEAPLPVELVTLLIPRAIQAANVGILEPVAVEGEGTSVRAYRYSVAGTVEYLFVFSSAQRIWRVGPCSSDAKFLFYEAGCGQRPNRFVICDGRYLAIGGRQILDAKESVKYAESFLEGDQPRISRSNENRDSCGSIERTTNALTGLDNNLAARR